MDNLEIAASKACIKCGEVKSLDEFYKQNIAKDGRTVRCKECCKADALANRRKKIEYYKAYDRQRANNPKRVAARKAYAATEAGRERQAAGAKAWMARNGEKRHAHNTFSNALRDGVISRPDQCFVCGAHTDKIHGHHFDYTKPLDVLWCCEPCHAGLHVMLRERERAKNGDSK